MMPPCRMAGEALAHVQASRLKANAIVFRRFTNSPSASASWRTFTAKKGVNHEKTDRRYHLMFDSTGMHVP